DDAKGRPRSSERVAFKWHTVQRKSAHVKAKADRSRGGSASRGREGSRHKEKADPEKVGEDSAQERGKAEAKACCRDETETNDEERAQEAKDQARGSEVGNSQEEEEDEEDGQEDEDEEEEDEVEDQGAISEAFEASGDEKSGSGNESDLAAARDAELDSNSDDNVDKSRLKNETETENAEDEEHAEVDVESDAEEPEVEDDEEERLEGEGDEEEDEEVEEEDEEVDAELEEELDTDDVEILQVRTWKVSRPKVAPPRRTVQVLSDDSSDEDAEVPSGLALRARSGRSPRRLANEVLWRVVPVRQVLVQKAKVEPVRQVSPAISAGPVRLSPRPAVNKLPDDLFQ
ncbi:unnamed protein product, partial [Polarella glacialis]